MYFESEKKLDHQCGAALNCIKKRLNINIIF